MKIENIYQLLKLIESDKLTNSQVSEITLKTLKLHLSQEETELPRTELTKRLKLFHDKYIATGHKITPLFLPLD